MHYYYHTRELARKMRKAPTPAENFFWQQVRNRKFMDLKFNRQFIMECRNIDFEIKYFITDFHVFSHRTVIELDGGIHLHQQEYDLEREKMIRTLGYSILRFENHKVLNDWPSVAAIMTRHFQNFPHP
ncbi:MAG: DUF559 domain-containing protein [Saprospiraceae bacterium]|nr:DUF559 domain-containing protein [Saprospiraceae bacterium]